MQVGLLHIVSSSSAPPLQSSHHLVICSEHAETMQRDCGRCDEYTNVLYILSCRDGDELQTLIHRLLPGRLNDSIFHQLFAELLYCDPHMTVRDFRETLRADADTDDKVIQAFLCDDIELVRITPLRPSPFLFLVSLDLPTPISPLTYLFQGN
jgi:hypothetical protein